MNKKFLAPFVKLFASFSAALLLSIPSVGDADTKQALPEKNQIIKQMPDIEINDFVLERSSDNDPAKLMGHWSHSSHRSHHSHHSHYSSRW